MIKNIVYLDVDKMYSLSSQIFEGVTEYVLSEKSNETEGSEEQKGPIGSGKVLGDILRKQERISEKKFLIDHSYAIFERKLLDEGRVSSIDKKNGISDSTIEYKNNSFIKIKCKVAFNDVRAIQGTIDNFNELGQALAYVTTFSDLEKQKEIAATQRETIKDRNKIAEFDTKIKKLTNLNDIAKQQGLHQDPKFLQSLSAVLKYGFHDQFEIQMKYGGTIFSANLKRDSLREDENLLIKKYSRNTEVEFVLFGIITQCKKNDLFEEELTEDAGMKQALINMIGILSNVESTFSGRLKNEIIIDPIALYTEIG